MTEAHPVIREFFELFKTPWEFYQRSGSYDVVIDTRGESTDLRARLVLRYGCTESHLDRMEKVSVRSHPNGTTLSWGDRTIPIYRGCLTSNAPSPCPLFDATTHEPVAWVGRSGDHTIVRVGFDLFEEVQFLLNTGQPPIYAAIPTLDLHIDLLRTLILGRGIGLIEIPPVPEGYRFMVCLTHDVDHPAIHFHKFDHTILGFLYRAVFGSITRVRTGSLSLRGLWRNWKAALLLPFVHAGWASDFWDNFGRYLEIERGLGSTFYVIPHANDSGQARGGGPAPSARASRYGVADIAPRLKRLASSGCEIGLHGIDAWFDPKKGIQERDQVSRVTGEPTAGVRMHWLFSDERTPTVLDNAGFSYDSTFGYNETVGFRAGTTQVFKPFATRELLELPLHIMDTALFYPSHLNLRPEEAQAAVAGLINEVDRLGGAFTANWHDRSLAPERLWEDCYLDLLGQLKRRNAWFPTARRAVAWFRQRRSASFDRVCWNEENVQVKVSAAASPGTPGLIARVHPPRRTQAASDLLRKPVGGFVDLPFKQTLDTSVAW